MFSVMGKRVKPARTDNIFTWPPSVVSLYTKPPKILQAKSTMGFEIGIIKFKEIKKIYKSQILSGILEYLDCQELKNPKNVPSWVQNHCMYWR